MSTIIWLGGVLNLGKAELEKSQPWISILRAVSSLSFGCQRMDGCTVHSCYLYLWCGMPISCYQRVRYRLLGVYTHSHGGSWCVYVHICVSVTVKCCDCCCTPFSLSSPDPPLSVNKERDDIRLYSQPLFVPDGLLTHRFMWARAVCVWVCVFTYEVNFIEMKIKFNWVGLIWMELNCIVCVCVCVCVWCADACTYSMFECVHIHLKLNWINLVCIELV